MTALDGSRRDASVQQQKIIGCAAVAQIIAQLLWPQKTKKQATQEGS